MRVVLFILILIITLSSCKKYDEGPSLSLLSKKARITGEWEVARCYFNNEQMQIVNKEEMTVDKNGTFSRVTLIGTSTSNTNGNWAFSGDKESLLLTYSASVTETWTIKRLTNKQLFIETTQPSGSLVRYELVKKIK